MSLEEHDLLVRILEPRGREEGPALFLERGLGDTS